MTSFTRNRLVSVCFEGTVPARVLQVEIGVSAQHPRPAVTGPQRGSH
jgi:hypothetical protein